MVGVVDCSAVDAQGLTSSQRISANAALLVARTCHRLAAAAIVLGVTALLGPPASAAVSSHGVDLPVTAIAASSAAAVHGVVSSVSALVEPGVGGIYTVVSIAVRHSWGLPGAPPSIDLKLLGGIVGRRALVVDGQATFRVGEEVFALLEVRPRDGTLAVTALGQGKWTIAPPPLVLVGSPRGRAALRDDGTARRSLDQLQTLATLTGAAVHAPRSLRVQVPRPQRDATEHDLGAPAAVVAAGRWHRVDSGVSVPVDASGMAFNGAAIAPLLMRALQTWTGESALSLSPGTLRDPRCFGDAATGDQRIVITFGDPCDEIADTSPVLAFGAAFFDVADTRVVGGAVYAGITSGVVVVDDAPAKVNPLGAVCLEELVTHELGHALGLGHVDDAASVMYPTLSPTCGHRATALPLSEGDRATLRERYPHGGSPTGPPASPVGLLAAVHGDGVRLRWGAATGPSASGYQLFAGSAPGESDLGTLPVGGPGLDLTAVPRGVYYLRVVAVNAAGMSSPSAEITVAVGANLPEAPAGLMASADDTGRVRVFWQAPSGAASSTTRYLLLARMPGDGRLIRVPVASTTFFAEGVPSGTYRLRVVAVTAAGPGPASREILLVVP